MNNMNMNYHMNYHYMNMNMNYHYEYEYELSYERDVEHRMHEEYRAWGALKSVLSNRGLVDKGQEVCI